MGTERYDYVIAGCGLAGAIIAREMAEKGKKILICERRSHIAGNTYDEMTQEGILVQRYGPHTFHTNREEVYNYLQRWAEFTPYRLTYLTIIKGKAVRCPFDFSAIRDLYDEQAAKFLISELRREFADEEKVPVFELLESKNEKIREYANLLFEEDFRPYTAKQWGVPPEQIDPNVIRRVPIVLGEQKSYFNDQFEGQPRGGFTAMFQRILDHSNITVQLETDFLDKVTFDENAGSILFDGKKNVKIIYTGPIDELFGYCFGMLPYRSLRFEYETLLTDSAQDAAIVAYPKAKGYTRITEYTKLPMQPKNKCTIIAREYPVSTDSRAKCEPYYPIQNEQNMLLVNRYFEKVKSYSNLFVCGRLAQYRYYNMDEVVDEALKLARILAAE